MLFNGECGRNMWGFIAIKVLSPNVESSECLQNVFFAAYVGKQVLYSLLAHFVLVFLAFVKF